MISMQLLQSKIWTNLFPELTTLKRERNVYILWSLLPGWA